MFQRIIRRHLQLPESKRLAIGVAIGYEDPDFPANQIVSTREDVDELIIWHGF